MVTIILIVVFSLGAILTTLWAISTMATCRCPHCAEENESVAVLPILPFMLFWCPNCSTVTRAAAVLRVSRDSDS